MKPLSIAFVLAVFWLLLSGHYTPLLLSFGVLSVFIVVWFVCRMDATDHEPRRLKPSLGLLRYVGWLLLEVVKANIDLARRIWDPKLPIAPRWERLDTRVSSPAEKALYANSITLTPGTLTTDVHEDHFMIHALSESGIQELRGGEMERRVREIGL